MINVRDKIEKCVLFYENFRRDLHEHPAVAFEEEYISKQIRTRLDELGIEYETGWGYHPDDADLPENQRRGGHGIVATIKGKGDTDDKIIALRADIDALPITEQSGQLWSSQNDGVMHACGHDGHTTMLLAAAEYLSLTRNFNGTVKLIFQPAEESTFGAQALIKEGLFERHGMTPQNSEIYAIHNTASRDLGKAAIREGPYLAGASFFEVTFEGKGGHAAFPDRNNSPHHAVSNFLSRFPIQKKDKNGHKGLINIGSYASGEKGACNVTPGEAKIWGTIRGHDIDLIEELEEKVQQVARQAAKKTPGIEAIVNFRDRVVPVCNSENQAKAARKVLEDALGSVNVQTPDPIMGGDDFGAYLKHIPGAYFYLGQSEPNTIHINNIHTGDYDFNDKLIPIGAEIWVRIVEERLPPSTPSPN